MNKKTIPLTKGFKYRIYPTPSQEEYLQQNFGAARFIYNYLLAEIKASNEAWKIDKTVIRPYVTGISLSYRLPSIKKSEGLAWLNDAPAQMLQCVCTQLASAYQRFFRKKIGYPRFKSKCDRQSITFSKQIYKLNGNKLSLSKCDDFFLVTIHRPLPSAGLKTCTISKTRTGKYYASFLCEYTPETTNGTGVIGIDVGITDLATLSNGLVLPNPRHYVTAQHRLARLQRQLSRKEKGSKNRNKVRLKVAKLHEHIANQRLDYIHKFTTSVIRENQAVAIESLQVKNMVKNHNLAKHIADAAWGEMRRQLVYKAVASRHCLLVLADPYYPSTQLCSHCSSKPSSKIKLGVVEWTCEYCGTVHARDNNAAKNLELLARSYQNQKQMLSESIAVVLAKPYVPLI